MKFIFKYISIGLLFGIGFSTAFHVYELTFGKEFYEEKIANLKLQLEELNSHYFKPGYKTFWDRLDENKPEPYLSFNLQRYKLLADSIQVSGEVSNAGPGIFKGYIVRVSALDKNGMIFAECEEWFKDLNPGDKDLIIFDCPFSEFDKDPDLGEVSFRLLHSLHEKTAVNDSQ